VIAPAVALILARGVSARPLALAAFALLALAVPAVYLVFLPDDPGGHLFTYPVRLLGAHWLAVAALVLLGAAALRQLMPRPR
jgi:hypothetical protein